MIELTDDLRAELVQRAEQEAPQEACGLLSGPQPRRGVVTGPTRLWPTQNAAAHPETTFFIDPDEQLRVLEEIWAGGEELAGVFHSHPRSAPTPSDRDRAMATAIERIRPKQATPLVWVIVGLPPCPLGCKGNTDAHCPECRDWGYVTRFFVGPLV